MKDKALTKEKLIKAVGDIIRSKGFSGIRISKVARLAEVDRKLFYRYFGSIDKLIEAYIIENDYWMLFAEHLNVISKDIQSLESQAMIIQILQELFKFFSSDKEMQNLMLLELSGAHAMLQSIPNVRESLGQNFLKQQISIFTTQNM
ncbi:TetR/AcrR family transcriptional regulator [bacterium]|nr:MAG: TetR/AcrR family transcriptional regulator [bacterium]